MLRKKFVAYLMLPIYSAKQWHVVFTNEVQNYRPPGSLIFCYTVSPLAGSSVLASLAAKLLFAMIYSRFDERAVSFVKSILGEVITNQIGKPLDSRFLTKFNKIRIKDGTRFDLPQRLKENFPGFGGKITSDAAACVQYEFDLKSRCLLDLDITSAKKTDYQDAKEKVDQVNYWDQQVTTNEIPPVHVPVVCKVHPVPCN